MSSETYLTIPQLAKLLGVSRIAIYNRVKKGQIAAFKIGRTYAIKDKTIADILGRKTTGKRRQRIDAAVRRTVREYGEVLKRLSGE
jgi:excisionase family DNA binding protein